MNHRNPEIRSLVDFPSTCGKTLRPVSHDIVHLSHLGGKSPSPGAQRTRRNSRNFPWRWTSCLRRHSRPRRRPEVMPPSPLGTPCIFRMRFAGSSRGGRRDSKDAIMPLKSILSSDTCCCRISATLSSVRLTTYTRHAHDMHTTCPQHDVPCLPPCLPPTSDATRRAGTRRREKSPVHIVHLMRASTKFLEARGSAIPPADGGG